MNNKKGSTFLEYTAIMLIVILALLGMQKYIQRSISGRWRQAADVFGSGRQYQPNVTTITEE